MQSLASVCTATLTPPASFPNPSPNPSPDAPGLQLQPGHISRDQLVSTAFLLLVAGNATVAGMINLGVVTLLDHQQQLDRLKVRAQALVPAAWLAG